MNLQSNDFELLDLPRQFSLDKTLLDSRWKDLQRQVHPDRHAAQGVVAQRVAMQWSVRINEAYTRLKHPLRRAAYLCALAGVALGEQDNTAMPQAFLMQQMQWREALEDASSLSQLERLAETVAQVRQTIFCDCERLMDVEQDYSAAAAQVRALMFIERFEKDLNERITAVELTSG